MACGYEITEPKEKPRSAHYEEVRAVVANALQKGVQTFELSMKFHLTALCL